ncbi:DUF2306 domain-containing protein [Hymenobacter cellulosivorans]|uniref:DUF2306 domain-containing protein n=1 Tax=Hymenobacter cellulosivorans TaxID=2932249 RepID=A0ABY4F875_9BACT|nr:DUF2306 domain-containing protein [Hymenobacter cellulosivorans]UOQ52411.1 DUF2306 domain-containing protein [Hymenobacter cellulosivorans]
MSFPAFPAFFALPATALPIRLLLGIHIAVGTIALLAGLVPMLGRKGGLLHIRAGRVYIYAMMAVALTAVLLCVLQPLALSRLFLTGVAVLSFYLSFSGWRAARRHSSRLPFPDRLLAVAAVLVGLFMLVMGLWLQAILFAFFGGLLCLFAGRDTKDFLRPSLAPTPWLLRHFTRLGGSYISAATAFIVVNLGRWLPDGAPAWSSLVGWIVPTVIGTWLISRTVRRYHAQRATTTVGPLS